MLIATVSTQRSGTKLLASCFNSGTQVRSLGEIFNPDISALGSFTTFLRAEQQKIGITSADEILDRFFEQILHVWRPLHFDVLFNQLELTCTSWNPYPGYFIYGYLQRRSALIISLERDICDTYVSGKYLEQSGIAHSPASSTAIPTQTLNVEDFRTYAVSILRHRRRLYEEMQAYPHFVRLSYEDLSKGAAIPFDLAKSIISWSKAVEIDILQGYLQIHAPPPSRVDVDYSSVFTNIEDIRTETQTLSGLR